MSPDTGGFRARTVAWFMVLALLPSCTHQAAPPFDPAALHVARHGHGAAHLDGGVLFFGGHAREMARPASIWIDFERGTRVPRAAMQPHRTFFATVVADGAAYAIGSDIQRYDIARDDWRSVCRDPRLPRSHLTAAAHGGSIYIVAGLPADRPGFLRFDPATAELHVLPNPPGSTPGDHLAPLVVLDGALHLFGGLSGADTQPMTRHAVWNGTAWETRADAPVPIEAKFGAFGVIDDVAYFFGLEGTAAYDAARGAWRPCAEIPERRAMAQSVVLDGRLHVLGGMGATDVLIYDPARDAWHRAAPAPDS